MDVLFKFYPWVIEMPSREEMPKFYRRIWLNKEGSASTGTAVAFSGVVKWKSDSEKTITFLEISDCHCKVKLHKTYSDSNEDFIEKMRKLSQLASNFADFLQKDIEATNAK